jgi:Domain of unknown function (DUF3331)
MSQEKETMEPDASRFDPWRQILIKLNEACVSVSVDKAAPPKTRRALSLAARALEGGTKYASSSTCITINVLERLERVAMIAWYDPTSCHYAEQRWHRATSLRIGTCALTGVLIGRGDDIFRPSRASPQPVNADAMILTRALPEALSLELALSPCSRESQK